MAQAEEAQIWNYKSILDQLCRVNDNPNKVQEAEDKLLSMKQGTDSLHAYMAKFERVLYEARGHDWPDVNKISTFKNSLHPSIRSRLSQQLNLPRTYADFIKIVQQLASRSSGSIPSAEQKTSQPYHKSDAIDLNQVEINTIQVRSTTPPCARLTSRTITPPRARTTSRFTSPQRARSTSPALRDQYRKASKCVRRGNKGHWVQNCPFDPYKASSGKKVTIAAISDDNYNTDDFEPNVYDRYSSDSGNDKYDPGNDCDPDGYNPANPLGPNNWERQLAKKQ